MVPTAETACWKTLDGGFELDTKPAAGAEEAEEEAEAAVEEELANRLENGVETAPLPLLSLGADWLIPRTEANRPPLPNFSGV